MKQTTKQLNNEGNSSFLGGIRILQLILLGVLT